MKRVNWLLAGMVLVSTAASPLGGATRAQDYQAWRAWPDDYRRGFAMALLMEELTVCLGEGCSLTRHRRACLVGVSDRAVVAWVDRYVAAHPQARSLPVNVIVGRALLAQCGPAP